MASQAIENYWKRPTRRRMLAGAGTGAAAFAAAFAVGCGDDSTKPSGTTTTAPATAPSTASAAASAAASATPVDLSKLPEADFYNAIPSVIAKNWTDKDVKLGGKSVRLFNQTPTLDIQSTPTGSPTAEVVLAAYNRIIRLDCSQSLKDSSAIVIQGDLAMKWERPDVNTMVFTLNPGIKWQDAPPVNGRAFSVDDIKYMFDRGKNFPTSAYKSVWSLFGTPEDIGNNQFRVKLDKPHPAMDLLFTQQYMLAMPHELADNADDAKVKAVGTGPFILDKSTPNVSYEFRKNPAYFKKDAMGRQLPYLDSHTMSIVADPATRQAIFENGGAQWIYASAAPFISTDTAYGFLKAHPTFQIEKAQSIWSGLSLLGHLDSGPYADPRVREALNRLFDRPTLSKSLFKNLAIFIPYFVWPAIFDKAPGLDQLPKWQFNVQTAKQLLSAAGFPNGMDMDLQYYDVAGSQDIITIYQQSAAQGGVNLKLKKVADLAANTNSLRAGDWSGLAFWPRNLDYPDPHATIGAFTAGHPLNFGKLSDPTFQALYDKQITATGDDRKAILKQIWDRMVDQVYSLDFPAAPSISIFRPELRNFNHTSWNANQGQGMGQVDSVWFA